MIIPRFGKANNRVGFDNALQAVINSGSPERLPSSLLYENNFRWNKDFNVQFGYKSDKMSDTLRVEFNPNKCDLNKLASIFAILRPNQFSFIYFSRLDIAVDYLKTINPTFIKDRKKLQSHCHCRVGKGIESLYFGSQQSENQIRIYNKLTERLKMEINPKRISEKLPRLKESDFDSPWWRIEAQMRLDLHCYQDFRNNPFDNLEIYKGLPHTGDWTVKAFQALAYRDGLDSAFKNLPTNTRYRFQKKLESYLDWEIEHPRTVFNEHADNLFKDFSKDLEDVFNQGQFLFSHMGYGSLYHDDSDN